MSRSKVSVVVSKLYDISDFVGQPKTRWPKIPLPKFVPEQMPVPKFAPELPSYQNLYRSCLGPEGGPWGGCFLMSDVPL